MNFAFLKNQKKLLAVDRSKEMIDVATRNLNIRSIFLVVLIFIFILLVLGSMISGDGMGIIAIAPMLLQTPFPVIIISLVCAFWTWLIKDYLYVLFIRVKRHAGFSLFFSMSTIFLVIVTISLAILTILFIGSYNLSRSNLRALYSADKIDVATARTGTELGAATKDALMSKLEASLNSSNLNSLAILYSTSESNNKIEESIERHRDGIAMIRRRDSKYTFAALEVYPEDCNTDSRYTYHRFSGSIHGFAVQSKNSGRWYLTTFNETWKTPQLPQQNTCPSIKY